MANTKSIDLEAGSSQYLSIADASQTGLDITGDITMECWVKFESLPSSGSGMRIFDKDNYSSSRGYYFDFIDRTSSPIGKHLNAYFDISGDNTARVAWSPSTDTWYHIAVTRNATSGDVKFYVDGSQQGSTQSTDSGDIDNSTAPFNIGARYGLAIVTGKHRI